MHKFNNFSTTYVFIHKYAVLLSQLGFVLCKSLFFAELLKDFLCAIFRKKIVLYGYVLARRRVQRTAKYQLYFERTSDVFISLEVFGVRKCFSHFSSRLVYLIDYHLK